MRLTLTVVDPFGGDTADVVLDADPESTVGDIAQELAAQVGHGGAQVIPIGHQGQAPAGNAPPVYVDGYAVDPSATVVGSPLRDGAVVSLQDPSGCLPGEPTGLVELRVVGGPAAGTVHRLGVGRYDIGSGPAATLRVDDPEVDARALTLSVATDGTCRVALHCDEEGVTLDGAPFTDPEGTEEGRAKGKEKGKGRRKRRSKGRRKDGGRGEDAGGKAPGTRDWPLGGQIGVGNTLLELTRYTPPNAALKWSDDGMGLDYNRPPRLRPPERQTNFRLPSAPREYEARPLPWIMALTPLVGAVVMVTIFQRWYYLIMAALSPVLLFANYFSDKKHGRKSHAKQVKEYEEQKERIEKDAQEALVQERNDRRHAIPDPATVLSLGTGPRTRLWERRRTDRDHLLLRFGTGRLPSEVVLDDPEQDDHRRQVTWKIEDAPVALRLRSLGVIGVAGPGDSARALGRWAVAQTAALHSPMDVQFYVLSENSARESWDWIRWLPHARPSGGQDVNVLIGTDAETVGARIGELTQILDARKKAAEENRSQGTTFSDPDIVVVWDGSRRLRSLPGVVRLLREGPAVSMYALCLDAEERFLPGECQAFVVAEPKAEEDDREQRPEQPQQQVSGGFPSFQAWHAGAAAEPGRAGVPDRLRLRVEEAGAERLKDVRPDFVSPAWCLRLARSLSPLRDISGETEDSALPGSSRLLDVLQLEPPTSEAITARWRMGGQSTLAVIGESYDGPFGIDIRKDGPHGLIAGTTGSGKSELLQTIVAALAVANTPENMTFVLVDYKGGSAFKDCVKLPHTVGMVTDLDAHLVERALESLGAELKRREHILAAADAKDIEDYQDLVRRDPSHAPVPRLLIVIDEFASMVRDLPDFVTGLVNIAQRGRSLGIHLLLATQRPSGVVSPEIRANTNLRIALRVTDAGESTDVIDSPEAGHIAKSTPGRAYARLGHASLVPFQSGRVGGRRPGAADPAALAPWVGPLAWEDLGRAALAKPKSQVREDDEITDLKVLVDAVRDANDSLGIPAQHSPWLPALDETLLLDDVEVPAVALAPGRLPPAPYGVEDLPADQARRPVVVDFATFGHLMIGGAPRSGRSQVLRTIAGSLARTHSVADVHLYGIDCGNGALNALTRLPHCGAVVGRNQTERVIRLVNRLKGELSRRQDLLADKGFADIGEQRAAVAEDERLPHIVVLLDRWEGWVPTLGEIDHGSLTDELQTMMREGASVGIHLVLTGDRTLLVGRIATLTEDKYGLRLADRSDFSSLGIPARKVPEEIPPGRAFRNEAGTETQFALLSEDTTGQGQAAALAAIGEAAAARDAGVPRARRPFRVDSLPSRISFPEAWELRDPEASRSRLWALAGIGGDEIVGFGPDLAEGVPAFVIAGPAKSGRSTVLMNFAQSFLAHGTRLVIAAPRQSPLRRLDGAEGVLKVFTGDDIDEDDFEELIDGASTEAPIAVLVDDGEILEDCDAESQLKKLVSRGAERGLALVIAGDEEDVCSGFSGWQVDAKKARRGILLSPQESSSGDLIGLRLSRSMVGGQVVPGKGMLHLGDGELRTVVVPG
ncbi:FtsK/SpoIIIE domain-containing protein [Streptomyces griseomycini]|uniref:S-DNA-T family DNA segregation ATPase FtsK/SpoIIIE n=1 Tax=Streptomyces griseomycini TaxID=66895 RepID=A0A7W7PXH5_9ACTN|nr:FtsK/SpoIIIE domain-containing protein [Streptomyces griseomycini]MBB4903114.1 S-DNA-T family DNA segregation ATPase FtsK/SpoIIIE [Streptomyces griseomycini]GGQ20498.1 cell division protein FtsK [Streptomyces griseomycini]GGR43232.1 cell division protein FtsK [Streptomyces griseomycini]